MGTSAGGIAIKTETKNLDLQTTLSNLLGENFVQQGEYCDSRKENCFYVSKMEDYLVICNANLVREVFSEEKSINLEKIKTYFNQPSIIFAFEEYDSGGTYSYAIVENGEMKRKFSSQSYETVIDEGELYPIELKWKNARTEMEYDEDEDDEEDREELGLIYFNPDDESEYYAEENLPKLFLDELMQEKLGFDLDTLDDIKLADGYFKKS